MGEWLLPIHRQRRQHFAYAIGRRLFLRQADNRYRAYFQLGDTVQFKPRTTGDLFVLFQHLPALASPVKVNLTDEEDFWSLHGPRSTLVRPYQELRDPSSTFGHFIERLQPWEKELLHHTRIDHSQQAFVQCLTHGFRVVSDGSVKDINGDGSFGWVLSSTTGIRMAFGMGPVRGRSVHSYRSPIPLTLSHQVPRVHTATEVWPGILGTDGQSVIDTLRGRDRDPQEQETPIDLDEGKVILDVLCSEWDVLVEIQAAFKQLPGLILQYVKGHQDRDKRYDQQIGRAHV